MQSNYIESNLIAPCGMNCAICSSFLAYKNKIPQKGRTITYCKGCRPRNKQCAFLKKKCKNDLKLLKGEIDFCFECNFYPCEKLTRLDERYKRDYKMSMIENLELIKNEGLNKFIEKQYIKYRCKKCNELISVHNKKCFICESINSLRD